MAYPATPGGDPSDLELKEFFLDLGSRKEFRALVPSGAPPPEEPSRHPYGFGLGSPDGSVPEVSGLRLHGSQAFVSNLSNPDTTLTRLLLNWQTGTGKTIGAISISQAYIRQFQTRVTVLPADRPTVFVIGFTKTIIQNEMLRHPEFGFVSAEEVVEARRLRTIAERSGGSASPEARQYGGFLGVLRRRITDRARGGYYQFAGYKEFANRLFVVTSLGASRGFSVGGLYSREDHRRRPADEPDATIVEPTFLDRISAAVESGDVEVNTELLDTLRGGLIVADEIHNTYNIQHKNNYGVAIQYALDRLAADDPRGAPRAVFMSATVTSGSAAEIVDLLNFLVPVASLPGGRRLHRSDFFHMVEGADGRREARPLPGALDRIGRLSAGRVSFLLDTDEASYPRRIFEGVPLADPYTKAGDIPYLRFTPCAMSPWHEKSLAQMVETRRGAAETLSRVAIPANAYTLYDMAYPNPAHGPRAAASGAKSGAARAEFGLYLSTETAPRLAGAPPVWQAAAGVSVEPLRGGGGAAGAPSLISGAFLDLEPKAGAPPGIAAYSAKYRQLGADILDIVAGGPGKVLVYHHRVRMSGILQVQELLEMNGFIDGASAPSPSTRCAVCGVPRREHEGAAAKGAAAKAAKGAARAKAAKGATEKGATEKGAPAVGHRYTPARYLTINSEFESSVNERSIARYNAPSNMDGAEFRVLLGSKIIREGFDLKAVRHLLVASLPTDIPTLIQVFGRAVRKNSHRGLPADQRTVRIRIYVSTAGAFSGGAGAAPEVLRYAEKMAAYALTQEVERAVRRYAVDAFINFDRMRGSDQLLSKPNLDAIPYTPAISLAEIRARPETTATFEAYGHGDREVATIVEAIAALFETQPVWTYAALWAAVRSGRVRGVAVSASSFSEESFAAALDELGTHTPSVVYAAARSARSTISRVGDFYVRTPSDAAGQPVLDIESYVRSEAEIGRVELRVVDFVKSVRTRQNFVVRLEEFQATFSGPAGPPIEDAFVMFDADFHTALLRAIVEDAQGGGAGGAEAAAIAAAAPGSVVARAATLYKRFKILLVGLDLTNNPETKSYVRGGRPAAAKLCGYVGLDSVRLFAPGAGGGWYDIPRKALGLGVRYGENDIAVGYVERRGAHLRFKVREPVHVLSVADVRDVRSLARGAVCETRPRAMQESLALRLKALRADEFGGVGSVELCAQIRASLLRREEAARGRKRGMLDGARWFYLFNDRMPTITLSR